MKGYSPEFVYETGDQTELVKNCIVIVSYKNPNDSETKKNWDLNLGWTNKKGLLFPVYSVNSNVQGNKLTTGLILDPNAHHGPLFRFIEGKQIFFCLWPKEKASHQTVDLSNLSQSGLFSEWEPSKENEVVLSSLWPNYVKRIKEHNEKLQELLEKAKKELGTVSALYGLYSTGKDMIYKRQVKKYQKYLLKESKKLQNLGTLGTSLAHFESAMIIHEIINPTLKDIENSYKKISKNFENQIDTVAKELWEILQDEYFVSEYKKHHKLGMKNTKMLDEYRTMFSNAYMLLSRTTYQKDVYDKHLDPFYSERFKEVVNTCDWIGKLGGELLNVTNAYSHYSMATKLASQAVKKYKIHAVEMRVFHRDFYMTAHRLQELNLMQNVDELEDEINNAIKNRRSINTDKFVVESKVKANIVGSLQCGISLIKTVDAVMSLQKNDWKGTLGATKESLGFGSDLAGLPKLAEKLPRFAKVLKVGGVAGNVIDTGMAWHDMYQHAEPGMEEVFYTDFVMYMGKGIATAGAVLALTPFAPLGITLIAIGSAIDIIASITQGVLTYETVEQQKYKKIIDKAKDLDKNIVTAYENRFGIYARDTTFYKNILKASNPEPSANDVTKKVYGGIKDAIQEYYGKDKTLDEVFDEHWKVGWFDGAPYGVLDKFDLEGVLDQLD